MVPPSQERPNLAQGTQQNQGEMARNHAQSSQQLNTRNAKTTDAPATVCKFEELKNEFIVKREIGRGKF